MGAIKKREKRAVGKEMESNRSGFRTMFGSDPHPSHYFDSSVKPQPFV